MKTNVFDLFNLLQDKRVKICKALSLHWNQSYIDDNGIFGYKDYPDSEESIIIQYNQTKPNLSLEFKSPTLLELPSGDKVRSNQIEHLYIIKNNALVVDDIWIKLDLDTFELLKSKDYFPTDKEFRNELMKIDLTSLDLFPVEVKSFMDIVNNSFDLYQNKAKQKVLKEFFEVLPDTLDQVLKALGIYGDLYYPKFKAKEYLGTEIKYQFKGDTIPKIDEAFLCKSKVNDLHAFIQGYHAKVSTDLKGLSQDERKIYLDNEYQSLVENRKIIDKNRALINFYLSNSSTDFSSFSEYQEVNTDIGNLEFKFQLLKLALTLEK
jgi:hypothetical protein